MDLAACMAALELGDASYSVAQLKAQYKALALELHPDKKKYAPEEATERFKSLTSAYKRLLEAHASLREHSDLKASFQDHVGGASSSMPEPPVDPNKKFNAKKFNEVFQKTRTKTVDDSGYGRWMSSAPAEAAKEHNKHIQVYKEPMGLPAAGRGLAFNELGLEKIKDFSGDNGSDRRLNYTDYKMAHTSTSIIPDDPTVVASWTRQSYKNVEALEKAREDPRALKLSAQETARLARSQIKAEAREAQRQHALRTSDAAIEARHRAQRQLMFTGQ